MKIHEYQAKQILARYGVPVPKGEPAFSLGEVRPVAGRVLGLSKSSILVLKAQIHAGGRGKGGGVKLIRGGVEEAAAVAETMFGMRLVTHQTGPDGQIVRRIYLEEGLPIRRELYVALVLDRDRRRVAIVVSTEGGMEIEEVGHASPEKIISLHIDPLLGLAPFQSRRLTRALGLTTKALSNSCSSLLAALYRCFIAEDCSLLELNPLAVTADDELFALDAKVVTDDNAEIRHPEWGSLRDADEEDATELAAKRAGLSYVSLDGDIGCLVNGAGLAMATIDIIQQHGGSPANFLDVGGGASLEQVKTAFQIILRSEKVKGIFVNIFGGIMRCDVVASGIVAATKELALTVPLVVRLEGTNVAQGRHILSESALAIHPVETMAEGAHAIVAAVKSAGA
jgi:succinyl-CoA synthetase beta subunit